MDYQAYIDYFSSPAVWPVIAGIITWIIVWGLALYLVNAYFLMRIFRKAGVENSWLAFIPIANTWQLIKLGGYPGWIALAFLVSWVPFVGWILALTPLIFSWIAAYNIALKLGKEGYMVILYIFLPIVFNGICGLGKSQWNESLGVPVYSK